MRNIAIAGNIGRDAVTRTTQGGDSVTGWTVAVSVREGREEKTLWFDCSMWGKRGSSLAQYLTKGGKVAVSGEFSTREHEGKTYLTLRVADVTLMGGKPDGNQQWAADEGKRRQERGGYDQSPHGTRPGNGKPAAFEGLDDEIPFAPEFR